MLFRYVSFIGFKAVCGVREYIEKQINNAKDKKMSLFLENRNKCIKNITCILKIQLICYNKVTNKGDW